MIGKMFYLDVTGQFKITAVYCSCAMSDPCFWLLLQVSMLLLKMVTLVTCFSYTACSERLSSLKQSFFLCSSNSDKPK